MRGSARAAYSRDMDEPYEIEIDESCGICGEGTPVANGSFRGHDGGRVRWALWTCGHGWRSDAIPVSKDPRGSATTPAT